MKKDNITNIELMFFAEQLKKAGSQIIKSETLPSPSRMSSDDLKAIVDLLPNQAAVLAFFNHHFDEVARGTSRAVFKTKNRERVFKIALNRLGIDQNLSEIKLYDKLAGYVPEMYDFHPDGYWIEVEKVFTDIPEEQYRNVQKAIFLVKGEVEEPDPKAFKNLLLKTRLIAKKKDIEFAKIRKIKQKIVEETDPSILDNLKDQYDIIQLELRNLQKSYVEIENELHFNFRRMTMIYSGVSSSSIEEVVYYINFARALKRAGILDLSSINQFGKSPRTGNIVVVDYGFNSGNEEYLSKVYYQHQTGLRPKDLDTYHMEDMTKLDFNPKNIRKPSIKEQARKSPDIDYETMSNDLLYGKTFPEIKRIFEMLPNPEAILKFARLFGKENISEGSSRLVVRISEYETVIKVAKNPVGVEQNIAEINLYKRLFPYVPEMYDYHPLGYWIEAEEVEKEEDLDLDTFVWYLESFMGKSGNYEQAIERLEEKYRRYHDLKKELIDAKRDFLRVSRDSESYTDEERLEAGRRQYRIQQEMDGIATLYKFIPQTDPDEIDEQIEMFRMVSKFLEAGVRDLNPRNIGYSTNRKQVVVLDYGYDNNVRKKYNNPNLDPEFKSEKELFKRYAGLDPVIEPPKKIKEQSIGLRVSPDVKPEFLPHSMSLSELKAIVDMLPNAVSVFEFFKAHFVDIGSGSSRYVFPAGRNKNRAFKIAYNEMGVEQNKSEIKLYDAMKPFVPIVYGHHPDGYWIEVERVDPELPKDKLILLDVIFAINRRKNKTFSLSTFERYLNLFFRSLEVREELAEKREKFDIVQNEYFIQVNNKNTKKSFDLMDVVSKTRKQIKTLIEEADDIKYEISTLKDEKFYYTMLNNVFSEDEMKKYALFIELLLKNGIDDFGDANFGFSDLRNTVVILDYGWTNKNHETLHHVYLKRETSKKEPDELDYNYFYDKNKNVMNPRNLRRPEKKEIREQKGRSPDVKPEHLPSGLTKYEQIKRIFEMLPNPEAVLRFTDSLIGKNRKGRSGSSRVVIEIGNGRVIKVPINQAGILQNLNEIKMYEKVYPHVPTMYDYHPKGYWIEFEKVEDKFHDKGHNIHPREEVIFLKRFIEKHNGNVDLALKDAIKSAVAVDYGYIDVEMLKFLSVFFKAGIYDFNPGNFGISKSRNRMVLLDFGMDRDLDHLYNDDKNADKFFDEDELFLRNRDLEPKIK